jgi:uncharacterized protein with PhoU and TrkA domain
MKVVIDRFESDLAICEKPDRNMVKIPRSKLPFGVKEGDVLIIEGDTIVVDELETAQKRKQAEHLLKDLWK